MHNNENNNTKHTAVILNFLEPYKDKIEKLTLLIEKWARSRNPNLPENKVKALAKATATLIVLGCEWGEGDALAGYGLLTLERYVPRDARKTLVRLLRELGATLPETLELLTSSLESFAVELASEIKFNDEELDKELEKLRR